MTKHEHQTPDRTGCKSERNLLTSPPSDDLTRSFYSLPSILTSDKTYTTQMALRKRQEPTEIQHSSIDGAQD